MPRNTHKDKAEEMRRRRQLMDAGLRLFAEKGIETVSLQAVVDETDVGIATMYNYYKNKTNFVVAISADIWSQFWSEVSAKYSIDQISQFSVYELTEFYCDMIIELYTKRPEILRFSSNYKTYICRENVGQETVSTHLQVLEPVNMLYRKAFERDKANGIIKSDISVDEMYRTSAVTMLSMAERFAEGIVWTEGEEKLHISELKQIKEMILLWCKSC